MPKWIFFVQLFNKINFCVGAIQGPSARVTWQDEPVSAIIESKVKKCQSIIYVAALKDS